MEWAHWFRIHDDMVLGVGSIGVCGGRFRPSEASRNPPGAIWVARVEAELWIDVN